MAEADPTPPMVHAQVEPQVATPGRSRKRWLRLAAMLSLPLLLAVGALIYWQSLQGKVSTDNAYLKQEKISISAEVGGRIVDVRVREDQAVKAGDLLFRIDPEPYRLQIAQADAAIAGAQANVTALGNASELTGAEISAAREDIAFAEANFRRKDELFQRGFLTRTEHDAARHAVSQARESLRLAEARQGEARAKLATGAQVPGQNPQVAAARAQRASAALALSRTEVRAPVGGVVAQADRLHAGQQVVAGLPVVTVVADGTAYVEANFKETDLAEMRVGQRAEIEFDAYPGVVLKGHVASIGAGTGSEFSVLPAQNATGNWVKVTQRVPVRIAIDQKSPRQLIAGLSAEVTVFTGR